MPSGARTNLKVGAPVQSVSREYRSGAEPEKKFWGVTPLHFFGSKSTISRFGERFRNGQYSLVSFLFAVLLLTVLPVPSHLPPEPHGVGATGHAHPTVEQSATDVMVARNNVSQ